MKIRLAVILASFATPLFATVDGYKDIYLDREQPIHIHSIYCGQNLTDFRALKNNYAYTNTEYIEEGTYYFSSAYGDFSYTYKTLEGQDAKQLLARGLLTAGKTNKDEMIKEICIVGQVPGIPPQLANNIGKKTLSANDAEWDNTMVKLAMFGKPAFAEGVYTDQRTTARYDEKNKEVYLANQAYIAKAKELFTLKFEEISASLPKQLEDAIKYANQEDGFLTNKTYPVIQEPAVWTITAKERYDDQHRQLAQEKAWDQLIQKNFDWFFNLTARGNALTSVTLSPPSAMTMNGQVIEQIRTVNALFNNGKTLSLDFLIQSHKLPNEVFFSEQEIAQEANAIRGSAIAGSRETRKPIELPHDLDVYSSAEKTVIFFTPYREKKLGDTYNYQ